MKPVISVLGATLLLAPFVLLQLSSHAADAAAQNYCNWDNCNGIVQGDAWCNVNSERCEQGCGGKWCGADDEGPQQCTELKRKDCKQEQTCTWDRVSKACREIDPNNECDGLARKMCNAEETACTWSKANKMCQKIDPNNQCDGLKRKKCRANEACTWTARQGCTLAVMPPDESSTPSPGTPSPETTPAPTTTITPPPSGGGSGTLVATHFWDCSGAACDAKTLQPWNPDNYLYSALYAPIDPEEHGGAVYGEKMWMTGAASDALSEMLGPDDGCCGEDSESIGGCGKCVLVTNPSAVNSGWSAVVMKKNRCPPWSNGCDKPHLDIAVPGYDNLQFSTANTCGQPNTIISKEASATCGDWYSSGAADTTEGCSCDALPSSTEQEAMLKNGCKMFTEWGWKSGNPTLTFEVLPECPARFVEIVGGAFGPSGPIY